MPGIQVTDLSILEKVICAHKTTAYKMYIANYTSTISDTSWQKDIPDNSSLGLQLFIPFQKDICWRWAGVVLELAPEPTSQIAGLPRNLPNSQRLHREGNKSLILQGRAGAHQTVNYKTGSTFLAPACSLGFLMTNSSLLLLPEAALPEQPSSWVNPRLGWATRAAGRHGYVQKSGNTKGEERVQKRSFVSSFKQHKCQ